MKTHNEIIADKMKEFSKKYDMPEGGEEGFSMCYMNALTHKACLSHVGNPFFPMTAILASLIDQLKEPACGVDPNKLGECRRHLEETATLLAELGQGIMYYYSDDNNQNKN